MKKTLYEILGVDPKATAQEINAAYIARIDELKTATLQDPNKLRVLQQSKEILSDAIQRTTYDASLAEPETPASAVSQDEQESSFLHKWGKWIAAVVVMVGLFVLWPKRAAVPPPPPPAKRVAAEPTTAPQPTPPVQSTNAAPAVAAVPPTLEVPANPIAGEWSCTDAISGRTSRYNFQQDAILKIADSEGQIAESKYELAGKTLTLTESAKAVTLTVEELTTRKVILNTGAEGRRIVCRR